MSLLTDNVIPGNYGKTFSTNAKEVKDLERIKEAVATIHGVDKVEINTTVFPAEFTVYTHALVEVSAIEKKVNSLGFNTIPKDLFKV